MVARTGRALSGGRPARGLACTFNRNGRKEGCTTPPAGTLIFTHAGNLKTYGMACQPDDLLICKTSSVAPAISASSCGGAAPANQIMSQSLVVAIVFSTGKNGAIAPDATRTDEAAKFIDRDQLCLSPQCGFASTEEGNLLAEDEQWAKLAMIVEVAEEVWG